VHDALVLLVCRSGSVNMTDSRCRQVMVDLARK
jgi:hypothetical protein